MTQEPILTMQTKWPNIQLLQTHGIFGNTAPTGLNDHRSKRGRLGNNKQIKPDYQISKREHTYWLNYQNNLQLLFLYSMLSEGRTLINYGCLVLYCAIISAAHSLVSIHSIHFIRKCQRIIRMQTFPYQEETSNAHLLALFTRAE